MKNVIFINFQNQYNTGLFSPKKVYKQIKNNELAFEIFKKLIHEVENKSGNSIHLNFFYQRFNSDIRIPIFYPEFEDVEYIIKKDLLVRKGDTMTVMGINESGSSIPSLTTILYKSNPLKFPEKYEHLRYFKIKNEFYGNTNLPGQKLFLDGN